MYRYPCWCAVASAMVMVGCADRAQPNVLEPKTEQPLVQANALWKLMHAPLSEDGHARAAYTAIPGWGYLCRYGGMTQKGISDDLACWDQTLQAWVTLEPPTPVRPPPLLDATLAFDASFNLVLYGGRTADTPNALSANTWVLSSAWAAYSNGVAGGRYGHSMTTATVAGASYPVVFGGRNGAGAYPATPYRWTGSSWVAMTSSPPPPRVGHTALPWSGGILVTGGVGPSGYLQDAWWWQDTAWTQLVAGSLTPRVGGVAMDVGGGQALLLGGRGVGGQAAPAEVMNTTGAIMPLTVENMPPCLSFGGSDWSVTVVDGVDCGGAPQNAVYAFSWNGGQPALEQVDFPPRGPAERSTHALAYHAPLKRVVAFGGLDDDGNLSTATHTWDGTAWSEWELPNAPGGRTQHAMVPMAAGVLLFGGVTPSGTALDDTYLLTETGWTQVDSAEKPPARYGHAMATIFDDYVLLFGGSNGPNLLGDFWYFDPSLMQWFDLNEPGPSPRARHAMAWDAYADELFVYGGEDEAGVRADAWIWINGSGWQPLGDQAPGPRAGHSMTAHTDLGNLMLVVGGYGPDHVPLEESWQRTWLPTGLEWSQVFVSPSPSARALHGAAYFPEAGATVIEGGQGPQVLASDTWHYYPPLTTCSVDEQCSTGFCVDGYCCDSACGYGNPYDCLVCSKDLGGLFNGTCSALPQGLTCSDDGLPCTDNVCNQWGDCTHPVIAAGKFCADKTSCLNKGFCNGVTGGCDQTPKADGLACSASPGECQGAGSCLSGACQAPPLPAGTGCSDDSNPCTVDACNGSGVCSHAPKPDHSSCDDGDLCNGQEYCLSAQCQSAPPPNCDDGNLCTADSCVAALGCVHSSSCDDSDGCTEDSCDAQTGVCSHATVQCNGTALSCHALQCVNGGCAQVQLADGASCAEATPGECEVAQCAGGVCTVVPLADGVSCSGVLTDECELAQCVSGVCTAVVAPNGYACMPTSAAPCRTYQCGSGVCLESGNKPNGQVCTISGAATGCGNGLCSSGTCVIAPNPCTIINGQEGCAAGHCTPNGACDNAGSTCRRHMCLPCVGACDLGCNPDGTCIYVNCCSPGCGANP